jgi:hypothetical protein
MRKATYDAKLPEVRMHKEEVRWIKSRAKKMRLTCSALVRQVLRDYRQEKTAPKAPPPMKEVLWEGIGSLAEMLAETRGSDIETELHRILEEWRGNVYPESIRRHARKQRELEMQRKSHRETLEQRKEKF